MSLIWGLGVGLVLFLLLWLNLLSLPGNWLMLGVLCLAAWAGPEGAVTWAFVGWMALIAAAGEVFEFLAQLRGGTKGGASRGGNVAGVVGSILGAIFGAPFGLGLGSLMGALAGAWLGCYAWERLTSRGGEEAARAAWGAFWGRTLGLVGKSAAGATVIVLTVSRFFSHAGAF